MLPQYTSQYAQHDSDSRDTPTEPLLKSLNERISTETAPPTYPPGPSTQQPINVGYRYAPVYPRKGEIKNAVGVLCMTKQETIQYVQSRFPELQDVDSDKITFQSIYEPDQYWSDIFDEAWTHFQRNPPKRLNIIIVDSSGDKERRARRSKIIGVSIILSVFFALAVIPVLIRLFPQENSAAQITTL